MDQLSLDTAKVRWLIGKGRGLTISGGFHRSRRIRSFEVPFVASWPNFEPLSISVYSFWWTFTALSNFSLYSLLKSRRLLVRRACSLLAADLANLLTVGSLSFQPFPAAATVSARVARAAAASASLTSLVSLSWTLLKRLFAYTHETHVFPFLSWQKLSGWRGQRNTCPRSTHLCTGFLWHSGLSHVSRFCSTTLITCSSGRTSGGGHEHLYSLRLFGVSKA